jgi:hypothetical protein
MTLASIFIPNWIGWEVESPSGKFTKTLGLHRSCSSVDSTCRYFPQDEDCHVDDPHFCSMWRSVAFMMSAAALFELVTLVTFFMLITGGKQKRERGWRVLSFLLVLVGILQCASMAIVVCLSAYFDILSGNPSLIVHRRTSSITTTGFSLDGNCPKVGFFAQLAGASACSQRG